MMKNNKAFTISEAMIVLGIIGILAALSVIAITNSKPDENMIMFRRAYATTAKITQELMNDRELYPKADSPSITDSVLGSVNNKIGFQDSTITNEVKTKYPYLADVSVKRKFAAIFAHKANPVTTADSGTYGTKFTTADGIYWSVQDCFYNGCEPTGPKNTVPTNKRYGSITVYLNGENDNKSCSYNSETCPYPTKFSFIITPSGVIRPQDPMACSYLRYSKATKISQIPTDLAENSCFAEDFEGVPEEEPEEEPED